MSLFPYAFGPQGRSVSVDADGKIVAVSEDGRDSYIYGYGPTGRPLVVDASGRLIMSSLSNITASGGGAGSSPEQVWTSGGQITDQAVYTATNVRKFQDKLYVGTKNWVGSTSGAVYRFWYDESAGQVQWEEAFNLGGGSTSGWPALLETYHNKLYALPLEGASSGWLWEHDGSKGQVKLVGAVSGYNPDTGQQVASFLAIGLYDNKLVMSTVNNLFSGPSPIFYYDGTNFGEIARVRTTAGQWGWLRGITTWNNKMYLTQSNDKYVNIFDGIRNINIGSAVGFVSSKGYKGKLYFFGSDGLYEFSETDLTFTKVYSSRGACDFGHIYNGDLYFVDNSKWIVKFDGHSFSEVVDVGGSIVGLGDINGRLFAVCVNGAIFTYKPDTRESLSHGRADFVSNSHYENTEYLKKLLDYTGNKYVHNNGYWSDGSDTQRYPVYTSARVIAQSDPLSSGVAKLDTKLGDQAMPPSGWTGNMPATPEYGDQFFHLTSGYMRFGTSWQQQETPWPHHAAFWFDTTPETGELTVLTDAGTYYRIVSQVAASGGSVIGHGLTASASGITVTDEDSKGEYCVSYSMSFRGENNTNVFGAVFKNETRERGSQFERRLGSTDTGNVGGQMIISIENGDELSFRIMSTTASNNIYATSFNFTIHRLDRH